MWHDDEWCVYSEMLRKLLRKIFCQDCGGVLSGLKLRRRPAQDLLPLASNKVLGDIQVCLFGFMLLGQNKKRKISPRHDYHSQKDLFLFSLYTRCLCFHFEILMIKCMDKKSKTDRLKCHCKHLGDHYNFKEIRNLMFSFTCIWIDYIHGNFFSSYFSLCSEAQEEYFKMKRYSSL